MPEAIERILTTNVSSRIQSIAVAALLIAFSSFTSYAQKDTIVYVKDTTTLKSSVIDTSDSGHSPKLAMLLSAVVPGAGQAYNKKFWKIPLFYGAGAGVFYLNRQFNVRYLKYKNPYNYARSNDSTFNESSLITIDGEKYSASSIKEERDRFRRYRDMTIIGLSVFYVLNIVDAAVDAYFFDYDMSDNLSLHVTPYYFYNGYKNNTAGVSLKLRF